MAMRVTLLKNATAATTGASVIPRVSRAPYSFATGDGFTGTVDVEASVTSLSVADADVTDWRSIGTIGPEDQISWHDPIYRVRGNPAAVASGAATLYMLEEQSDRIDR